MDFLSWNNDDDDVLNRVIKTLKHIKEDTLMKWNLCRYLVNMVPKAVKY